MTGKPPIVPVIVANGFAARLWSGTEESRPCETLAAPSSPPRTASGLSLLQELALIISGSRYRPLWIVCPAIYELLVAAQLRRVGADGWTMVTEPKGRGSAAAVSAAARLIAAADTDALMLVLPASQQIGAPGRFHDLVEAAAAAASACRTGRIVQLREPDVTELADTGITLVRPLDWSAYVERLDPHLGWATTAAVEEAVREPNRIRLGMDYASAGRESVGALARSADALDLVGDLGRPPGETSDSPVGSSDPAPGRLRGEGTDDDGARVVHRPWGSFERLYAGPGFQIKRLSVKPGHRLSLQRHQHRAEEWVVVQGEAQAVRGLEALVLRVSESAHIPVGCIHRLGNDGPGVLELVEVQTGNYLGEDDIERLADDYERATPVESPITPSAQG